MNYQPNISRCFLRACPMGCEEVKLCTEGSDCAQHRNEESMKSLRFNGSFTKAINLLWLNVYSMGVAAASVLLSNSYKFGREFP